MRLVSAFLAAVLLTGILASIVQTQFVLAALIAVGAPVGLADRLAMTGADLLGFAPLYTGLIALGFLAAFGAGALVRRWTGLPPVLVYGAAGAACLALMLALMREAFFGVPLVAGARTPAGVLAQLACGALGGAVFGWARGRR